MSKRVLMHVFAVLLLTFSLLACKKDDDPKPHDAKFELTGTFTGTMALVYTAPNGGTSSEVITSLPWSKNISYEASVKTIYFSCTGNGTNGQTATLKIYIDGQERSSNSGTVSGGVVSLSAPTISL